MELGKGRLAFHKPIASILVSKVYYFICTVKMHIVKSVYWLYSQHIRTLGESHTYKQHGIAKNKKKKENYEEDRASHTFKEGFPTALREDSPSSSRAESWGLKDPSQHTRKHGTIFFSGIINYQKELQFGAALWSLLDTNFYVNFSSHCIMSLLSRQRLCYSARKDLDLNIISTEFW